MSALFGPAQTHPRASATNQNDTAHEPRTRTKYSYDAADRLVQAVDSVTGTISHSYDGLDRLTSEVTPLGSVSYGYDNAGHRTSMTVSGQTAITYQYDNANRLTQIAQGSAATVVIVPDNDSRRKSVTLPNGVSMNYGYEAASQLTGITYMLGSNTLGNLTYSYDLAGRRTAVGGSYARTGVPAASAASYNVNNQLTNWKGASLTYDANGNLTNDGTNTYTWNARNQLVTISGAVNASFQYDAFGRRVSKNINGTTQFLYDGPNPVQEISGSSAPANLITGGVDEYFQRTDSAGARSFMTDALGSTLALADSTGTLQTQYTFEPFGNTATTGSSTTNSFAFTGRELDPTGLYYYRARYYHPQLQRFIREDPIGLAGGTNLYKYAGDSATNLTDPFGLSPLAGKNCKPHCFAQLKYRPVDDWRAKLVGGTHSFWYVQGSDGVQKIISGFPSNMNGSGYLNIRSNNDINTAVDNVSATTQWDSGLSSDNCSGVDKLLNAANGFNQYGNYYDPFWGPNSNSAANYLGAAGGFDGGWNTGFGGPIAIPSPGPPGAIGWNTGVMP